MQLSCPSCNRKYQTEDYKDDFDIKCSCGYSILIPNESAIEEEIKQAQEEKAHLNIPLKIKDPTNLEEAQIFENPEFDLNSPSSEESPLEFSNVPAAQDAEDEAYVISGDLVEAPAPLDNNEAEAAVSAQEMNFTPPEQLPEEMPYDRFEIPNFGEGGKDFTGRFEKPLTEASSLPETSSPKNEAPSTIDKAAKSGTSWTPPEKSSAQVLIEKSVRASIGQLLGFSFDLKMKNLDEEKWKNLKVRASEFCHFRPWLGEEVKKRDIVIDDMPLNEWISNIPEALAVELYLKTLELGGHCEFKLSN